MNLRRIGFDQDRIGVNVTSDMTKILRQVSIILVRSFLAVPATTNRICSSIEDESLGTLPKQGLILKWFSYDVMHEIEKGI